MGTSKTSTKTHKSSTKGNRNNLEDRADSFLKSLEWQALDLLGEASPSATLPLGDTDAPPPLSSTTMQKTTTWERGNPLLVSLPM